jgi:putative two-component system response regulator
VLKDRRIFDSSIVIVDDEEANVVLLQRVLDFSGYTNLSGYTDPTEALAACVRTTPDLVVLDLHMPVLEGNDFLRRFRELVDDGDNVPVLVCTADVSPEVRKRSLSVGANDFIVKPFDATEIMLRVRNFLETRLLHRELKEHNARLEQRIQKRTADLEASRMEVLERLAKAAEYRDDDTGEHTRRVGDLSCAIAEEMNSPEVNPAHIRSAAMLHDIGKIGIPDAILLKPSKLTEEEYEFMKAHTTIGSEILSGSDSAILRLAEIIALTHHERWDGRGYPGGMAGEMIPLAGRIVAVADVYDALTHARPYKKAWPEAEAMAELERNSGSQFDPAVVEAFKRFKSSAKQAA